MNLKPSAIRKLGLTYAALREFNERIVCVALTGFGLYGGDEPVPRVHVPVGRGQGVVESVGAA